MTDENNVALIDMDQTLCDYEGAMMRDLKRLASPSDSIIWEKGKEAPYIRSRMDIIRSDPQWWTNLEPIPQGIKLVRLLDEVGFRTVILTQGPKLNSSAWEGKFIWCRKHLGDIDIIITRDKSLVYGKILVDDWPEYAEKWLFHRPRGVVFMPWRDYNKVFCHKNVFRYTDQNLNHYGDDKGIADDYVGSDLMTATLIKILGRKAGETVKLN